MEYTWEISWVKTKDYQDMPNSVHSIRAEYIGTNEQNQLGRYELLITLAPPKPDTFVPYDELTKEQIVSWFVDNIGEDHWAHIYENINREIEESITKHGGLPNKGL